MIDIKNERLKQSMSQKRLAYEAGIDARTLRKLETGETVSAETYRTVCVALGIEPTFPSNNENKLASMASNHLNNSTKDGWFRSIHPHLTVVTLAIITMIGFPWMVFEGWDALTTNELDANLRMELVVEGACEADTAKYATATVEKAFPGSLVFQKSVVTGTKDCTIRMHMKVDAQSQSEVIKTLQAFNLDARILAFQSQ
jgi:transcriptional regulator with XRE-family HTH domain